MFRTHLKAMVGNINIKVSITYTAWSSVIKRGYIAITLHWVDDAWNMNRLFLKFRRSIAPNIAESVSTFLCEVF